MILYSCLLQESDSKTSEKFDAEKLQTEIDELRNHLNEVEDQVRQLKDQ